MRLLSVIMPVFNEAATIETIVARVMEAGSRLELDLELVIVDDRSSDGSYELLQRLADGDRRIQLVRHGSNRGKGAAVRTGLERALGEVIVIQDADLEYHPGDYPRLLEPLRLDLADVVYGSRLLGPGRNRLRPAQAAANRLLTFLSNRLTGLRLTDMETCYKMFRAELVRGVQFTSERFGIEPELTAHFAHCRARLVEVPIDYRGRDHEAGKKIDFRDGLEAIWAIVKYNRGGGRERRREP